MASGSFRQADVLCPFYVTDNGKNIIDCEGLTKGGKLRTLYKRNDLQRKQMEQFCCCDNYRRCLIYIANQTKYEDDDRRGV